MNERPLFDVTALQVRCPICAAQRDPGEQRTADCGVDQSRAAGDWLRRPTECLNHPRPETDPLPEGF